MTITIAHTKGGVGKSTLAWHLAHSYKRAGKKVVLIDLDFQQTLFFVNALSDGNIQVLQPRDVAELFEVALTRAHKDTTYIIDVGGFDSDINRAAIDIAHQVLIPISASITEVIGFKTFEAILEETNILGEKDIAVVLNNIHPSTTNFTTIKEAVSDRYRILNTVVRNRKAYKETMGVGLSVFDGKYEQAQNEIDGVKDEL